MPEYDYIQKMIEDQESLRRMLDPADYVQRMIEDLESLRRMLEPPDHVQKIIGEQETFREILAPEGVAATALKSLLSQRAFDPLDITEKFKSFADELSAADFCINNDGSLSFEDQSIDVFELNIAVRTFFNEISDESSIENVLSRLACLKKPVQRIAIWLLNHIFVAFFVSVTAKKVA